MTPTPAGVLLVAAFYGIVALAATIAVGGIAWQTSRRPSGAQIGQMLVTVGAAAIGGFAASRQLTAEEILASALIVGALSAAAVSRVPTGNRSLEIVGAAFMIVALAAVLDGMWWTLGGAAIASAPFFGTAAFVRDRRTSAFDGCVAAIAGLALGRPATAIVVLFLACLAAIAYVKVVRRGSPSARFAPYIASFTLATVLLQVALVA